jgi:hypothetical protein
VHAQAELRTTMQLGMSAGTENHLRMVKHPWLPVMGGLWRGDSDLVKQVS